MLLCTYLEPFICRSRMAWQTLIKWAPQRCCEDGRHTIPSERDERRFLEALPFTVSGSTWNPTPTAHGWTSLPKLSREKGHRETGKFPKSIYTGHENSSRRDLFVPEIHEKRGLRTAVSECGEEYEALILLWQTTRGSLHERSLAINHQKLPI